MIIEQVVEEESLEAAQDNLAGQKMLPSCILVYIRLPRISQHRHEVVALHRCQTPVGDTSEALKKGQRQVDSLNLVSR
jgi:hypothetical protein